MERKDHLGKIGRLVVKVGSSVLAPSGAPRPGVFRSLAKQITTLMGRHVEVALVSSGAIASGRAALGLSRNALTVQDKQAAAAVGQSLLMEAYRRAFSPTRRKVAQVLLTHGDLADRRRFLNARSTIKLLFSRHVLPIINENDTVATEEIRVGDNDNLSALVASLVEADLLLILTNTNGLFSGDPNLTAAAVRIPVIKEVDEAMERQAGGPFGTYGVGGMLTKLEAAKKAALSGIPTIMADGREAGVILRAMQGQDIGTLFVPSQQALRSRKQWIAFSLKSKGRVVLDAGAAKAVVERKKSLLPSGIIRVEGQFERGDSVSMVSADGTEIARGLSNYGSSELARIMGVKTSAIEAILGYKFADEVVHRDNLVTL